jgi:predicted Zn-dependent protease
MNAGAQAGDEAREYLRKQSRIADLQIDKLGKEDEYELSHLRWRRFNDQMRGAIQIMTIAVGAVVVIALGAALWNASQADGLVVDAFSVPAGYAARGVGGDVVASDLNNHLAAVRERAIGYSYSTASSISRDNVNALSVEIPDTGISIAAVWRALRGWLGHERHLSGNLRESSDGTLVLTATLDSGAAITVGGRDLDRIEQDVAEKVFCIFDHVSCVNYFLGIERYDELENLDLLTSANDATAMSMAFAVKGFVLFAIRGKQDRGIALSKIGETYAPAFATPHKLLTVEYDARGRVAAILDEARQILTLKESDQPKHLQGQGFATMRREALHDIDRWHGDFSDALRHVCAGACAGPGDPLDKAWLEFMSHDSASARASVDRAALFGDPDEVVLAGVQTLARVEANDWAGVAERARAGIAFHDRDRNLWTRFANSGTALQLKGLLAVAQAKLGDIAGAKATLAATGGDCYSCLVARGDVDAVERNLGGASFWYAAADRQAPDVPFACFRWGALLMAKGDYNGAIAKFALANKKGPHFADPLEMWGEALMLKNRSDLALEKFEEANKYAPNWGQLHLKWGEALVYVGKREEAKTQFAIAAGLDLSTSDKSELAKMSAAHG